jgi:hypothetical protein
MRDDDAWIFGVDMVFVKSVTGGNVFRTPIARAGTRVTAPDSMSGGSCDVMEESRLDAATLQGFGKLFRMVHLCLERER